MFKILCLEFLCNLVNCRNYICLQNFVFYQKRDCCFNYKLCYINYICSNLYCPCSYKMQNFMNPNSKISNVIILRVIFDCKCIKKQQCL